jgi:hypothetical protein
MAADYPAVMSACGAFGITCKVNIDKKWLRTSGITAGIPVAAPLHHMDERLMHPEERRKQWRRAMQAD